MRKRGTGRAGVKVHSRTRGGSGSPRMETSLGSGSAGSARPPQGWRLIMDALYQQCAAVCPSRAPGIESIDAGPTRAR